ncbi:lipoprotein NlpI [Pseudobythopirellula maris]|uniref:Lipoprotein NlpI n=1 Tax=Pseudobythopirellula maris TaxID=2527991 RepID=A0A5C5ZNL8_9BACT|nr:tetratricopeptide repeat protein [Pseudobythopirellula maris]TWT88665.1 lipoprotein NlpI [Pseudobythopirellula maris]
MRRHVLSLPIALLLAAGLALPWSALPAVGQEPAEQTTSEQATSESAAPAEEPADEPEEALESEAASEPEAREEADPEPNANPGQADLDRALEMKFEATGIGDLNKVVDLIDLALEKGLDAENTDFAEQVLTATIFQRAAALSAAVLKNQNVDPRQDPRWTQIRSMALTDLMRCVSLDESLTDAWMLIGRLQSLKMGNKSEARRALTKVIQAAEAAAQDPALDQIEPDKLAQAYALRGVAREDGGRRLKDLNRAVELVPEKVEFLLLRAKHHQATGDAESCLADIDHALELEPGNFAVHELKALALLMQKKNEEALESFNRASELAPEALSPYQFRGKVYNELGDTEAALEQLDKAIELQPNDLTSLLIRAELYNAQERYQEALGDVETALALQPGLASAHLMRVRLLEVLGRGEEALATMQKIAQAAPNDPGVQLQLGLMHVSREQTEPAIEALSRTIDLAPANPIAYQLRGDMRLLVGDHAGAIEDFDRANTLAPDNPGVLNNYAWTLATSPNDDLRDGARAIELAREACELTEYEQPHILSTLAAAYAESGDFEQAQEWSAKAVAMGDEDYDGQLSKELASYQRGEPWRERQTEGVEEAEETEGDAPASDDADPMADKPADPAPAQTMSF